MRSDLLDERRRPACASAVGDVDVDERRRGRPRSSSAVEVVAAGRRPGRSGRRPGRGRARCRAGSRRTPAGPATSSSISRSTCVEVDRPGSLAPCRRSPCHEPAPRSSLTGRSATPHASCRSWFSTSTCSCCSRQSNTAPPLAAVDADGERVRALEQRDRRRCVNATSPGALERRAAPWPRPHVFCPNTMWPSLPWRETTNTASSTGSQRLVARCGSSAARRCAGRAGPASGYSMPTVRDAHAARRGRRSGRRRRPASLVRRRRAGARGTTRTASPGVPSATMLAVVEHHRPVADLAHEVGGVGDEDDRAALAAGTGATRSRHLRWNASSPTASTSSTSRIVGVDVDGHGEAEPHVHARRVVLHLLVDELLELGEGDDLVEARRRCRACDRPRIDALR